MLASVVGPFNVINVKDLRSIPVNLTEGLLHERHPPFIEIPSNRVEELIDIESAISVRVKVGKKDWNILLADAHLEVSADLSELVAIERLRAIVIHDLEKLLDAHNPPGSSRLEPVLEDRKQLLGRHHV